MNATEYAAAKISAEARATKAAPIRYLVSQGVPKNVAISMTILALQEEGLSLEVAFDAVLGKGSYAALAGAVWTELRQKAGLPV